MSDWRDSLGKMVADDEAAKQAADQKQKEDAAIFRDTTAGAKRHIESVVFPALEELKSEMARLERVMEK